MWQEAEVQPNQYYQKLISLFSSLASTDDILYPIKEQIELAELIQNATFREITSKYGHDAFLIEFEQINNALTSFQKVRLSKSSA